MDFFRADQLSFDPRPQISKIFVDGFYEWLKYFSKDQEKLTRAFQHFFQTNAFYVAAEGNKVLSVAACPLKNNKSVILNKREFIKHLGFIIGRIAYMILHKEFEVKQYPIEIPDNMGQIEFVATSESSRGKGIAFALLEYVIANTNYDQYILEVASNNEKAIKLYNRLGFKEVKRVPLKNAKKAGFENLLYLQKNK